MSTGRGRARGRAAGTHPPDESPSPPGGGSPVQGRVSPDDGNGNGNGNGDDGAVRGRGSLREGAPLRTRPEGRESRAVGGPGQTVGLFANYFRVDASQDKVMTDYRVDFDPEVEMRKTRRKLVSTQAALFGGAYVYDGVSNLKSIQQAPNEVTEVTVQNEATGEPVKITFKRGNEIGWFHPEMLRFLNTQLRRNFDSLKYLLIFRHYFDPTKTKDIPQHKIKIMSGLATAIAQHDGGLLMVCDTVSKIVQMETVFDLMSKARSSNPSDYLNIIKHKLLGTIVMTTYNNKTYKIADIAADKNPKSTFERRGIQTSYIKYYKEVYDREIRVPGQPLLLVNPTTREIRMATQQGRPPPGPIYLVPELCVITGLTEEQVGDFNLKRTMTQSTQLDPGQRFMAMKEFADKLKGNPEVQSNLNQWGISYANMPLAIDGRVLPPEPLYMNGDTSWSNPIPFGQEQSNFEKEFRGKRMFDPGEAAEVKDWVIFAGERQRADVTEFAQTLHRVSTPLGMNLNRPRQEILQDDRPSAFSAALMSKTNSAKLVVCIVPNNDKSRYDLIKKFCYIQKGVASQVVVARTLAKKQQLMSVCTKVGLQIATKLGASPWSFKIPPTGLMVVGFDTYHDGTRVGQSVGGLVASLNRALTQYYSRVHYSANRDEMSTGVANLFREALVQYRAKNQVLPKTIIFYRDGVGDGMINHVYNIEVVALKRVIEELGGGDGNIAFAFIIVTKRINTRFFLKGDRRKKELKNPTPGTIVDTDVTRPERYEFYCVSQSVRAGTVSPTNYNIIYDTTTFRPTNQQTLVYKLTHLYFNWAGTIRVPAPCQYAHKLAFLTGTSLHAEPSAEMAHNLYYL